MDPEWIATGSGPPSAIRVATSYQLALAALFVTDFLAEAFLATDFLPEGFFVVDFFAGVASVLCAGVR